MIASLGKAVVSKKVERLRFSVRMDEKELAKKTCLKVILEAFEKMFPNLESFRVTFRYFYDFHKVSFLLCFRISVAVFHEFNSIF